MSFAFPFFFVFLSIYLWGCLCTREASLRWGCAMSHIQLWRKVCAMLCSGLLVCGAMRTMCVCVCAFGMCIYVRACMCVRVRACVYGHGCVYEPFLF